METFYERHYFRYYKFRVTRRGSDNINIISQSGSIKKQKRNNMIKYSLSVAKTTCIHSKKTPYYFRYLQSSLGRPRLAH